MLRALLARKIIVAADIALIAVFVCMIALIVREALTKGVEPGPVSFQNASLDSNIITFSTVKDRSAYDALIKRGLFGNAGTFDVAKKTPPPAKAPEPPTDDAEETKLPLKLLGTTLAGLQDAAAAAIIEVRQGPTKISAFFINNEIIPQVFLKEIRQDEVILDNQKNKRLESLKLKRGERGAKPVLRSASVLSSIKPTARRTVRTSSNMITLQRADITRRLEEEYARIASTLNVRVVKDENGKPLGVTTDNIESISVANELGFKNGDVLVSINNEPVDSRDKAAEVVRKYRNASIFRIGILRDGQPQYINYRVR